MGLALGGGSAKRIAHAGVLQWLEEHRVPVDAIAGTSMGGFRRRRVRDRDVHRRRKEDGREYPKASEHSLERVARGGRKAHALADHE